MFNKEEKQQYLIFLSNLITEKRLARMNEVLANRTRHLTIVLEDIYQSHNASAVLRSCECFGIHDIHIIENRNEYKVNPDVALGASKWVNLYIYNEGDNNTVVCLEKLKKEGYRIVATTPHEKDYNIKELDIQNKTALVFGNELDGLSQCAKTMADAFVKIPMYGFTESLNISVSAAICLFTLSTELHQMATPWGLTKEEKTETLINWIKNTIKNPDKVEKEFILRIPKSRNAGIGM